ncbi:MAG: hypothetical protein AAF636_10650 [Pseudomonadota bacterium]
MAGISRRYFVAATTAAALGPKLATATTEPVTHADIVLFVDKFGAKGDCTREKSTAGSTDDSDAIEAALTACPDHGTVRFTAGRCYRVNRPIEVTGKSLTLDIRDATIRCGNDSVWHVFRIGGSKRAAPVAQVTVLGGTFDGNRAHQRYWPNQSAEKIFTDHGIEDPNTALGKPFYDNSPVNGTNWRQGWLSGEAGDGINVNGSGNKGLIRVQHAHLVRFMHCTAVDYIRNGFATWNCADVLFFDCHSRGQLPTTYFELKALGGRGYEAAFLKVAGSNPDQRALQGAHAVSVRVIGGRVEGGAMPFFMRIQGQKPVSSGSFCQISGFEALGISRELWFEDCASVRISDSTIICHGSEKSRYRNDPALFFSNRTHDWTLSNCYIQGRINTNQSQDRRFGVLESCMLECDAPLDDWVVQCDRISNSMVRSAGKGALCRAAVTSEFYAETGASLFATETVRGCRIGAARFDGTTTRLFLPEGAHMVTLPRVPAGLNHLRIRNLGVMGGRWFEIHKANFQLSGNRLELRRLKDTFTARAGDEIEVSWYGADAAPLPYAGMRLRGGATTIADADVMVKNTRRNRLAGTCRLTGRFQDIHDDRAFDIGQGASVEVSGVTVCRCDGTVFGAHPRAIVHRLIIRGSWFEDWGLRRAELDAGAGRPLDRLQVSDLLQLTGTTFLRSRPSQARGGQTAPALNRGTVALLIEGDNVYAGGARPARFTAARALRKPDFNE